MENVKLVLRLIIPVIILQKLSGENLKVLVFQPDGRATSETIAVYDGGLTRNTVLSSLTICMRLKIYYLHGTDTFFQMTDSITNEFNGLRIEIFLDKIRPVFADVWQFHLFPRYLETFRWYHMCCLFDDSKNVTISYLNGMEIARSSLYLTRPIYGDKAFLGQGGWEYQSFSGEITQFNVWSKILSEELMKSIASCTIDDEGDYISWNANWNLQNVEQYKTNWKGLCNYREQNFVFGFDETLTNEAYYLCDSLGSFLPVPETVDDANRFMDLVEKTFSLNSTCVTDFFTPLNDHKKDGVFVTYYTNLPYPGPIAWYDQEPNGGTYENCAQFARRGVYDVDCDTRLGCTVCEFNDKVIYYLRGTCETELRNIYFLALQDKLNHLEFRGYGKYLIKKTKGIWQFTDISRNIILAEMEVPKFNYPMGRRNWTLFETLCGQTSGMRELLLTSCKEDKFTCDDGKCIPIENRCDLKYDCIDHSDERDCEIISYPIGYKKNLPPRKNDDFDEVLPILMNISTESISVDTALMEMRVSFFLEISWRDSRLNFINLKEISNLNFVSEEDVKKLWIPFIGFMNTIGNVFTEVDREAFMFVQKLSNETTVDESKAEEAHLFPGKENPFVTRRKYTSTFSCNFDLVLYPFDEQICDMEFQIISVSNKFVTFDANNTSAEHVGNKMLTEYQIGSVKILHLEFQEYSRVKIEVPLKRRAGYAILNIYIPSLILLTITYVTLFFRINIFDTRVMASLTTLLVVATLFTQVSTYLPKTSYFKAVDIWLLFCIATIFLIIIFHTIIDLVGFYSASNQKVSVWSPSLKKGIKISQQGFQRNIFYFDISAEKLITFARLTVFVLFCLFNIIYWATIFQ